MVKWAATGLVVLLMAAAFFLPERLSAAHDAQLLNRPVIQAGDAEQEGFAESIQLSAAEKLLLMRNGSMTAMELSREQVSGVFVNIAGSEEPAIDGGRTTGTYSNLSGEESGGYEAEIVQKWEQRLEAVKQEIRSLQAIGGLPELWDTESDLSYAGYGELLYMDSDTKLSFQVYRMSLESDPYTMNVTIDVETGRILSFSLRWTWTGKPNWGLRRAANFGGVWRNYWGMDSVSSGWYSESVKDILERSMDTGKINGDYNAQGQISFTYDGQNIWIPLECWMLGGRTTMLNWNC